MKFMSGWKRVELGEGYVEEFTLFEHKRLFSIILYRWHTIDQVRFHTHAFASVAILLAGWYWEKIRYGKHVMTNFVNVPFLPRYLPTNYCHAIENAKPGTLTINFRGPWQRTWWEYFPNTDQWVEYTWGRDKLRKPNPGETPKEVQQ